MAPRASMRRSTARSSGAVICPTGRSPSVGTISSSAQDVIRLRLRPLRRVLGQPLQRHSFKAIVTMPLRFLGLTVRAWIDAGSQQFSRFVALGARGFERHIGIHAKGKQLFLVLIPILKAPPFTTIGSDDYSQPVPISALIRLRARFQVANLCVSQRQGVTHSGKTTYPTKLPPLGRALSRNDLK